MSTYVVIAAEDVGRRHKVAFVSDACVYSIWNVSLSALRHDGSGAVLRN